MIPDLPTTMAHPAIARLVAAVPLCLALTAVLVVALLGGAALRAALSKLALRAVRRGSSVTVDPALVYVPEIVSPGRLVLLALAILLAGGLLSGLLAAWWLALLLLPPAAVLLLSLLLLLCERRYVHQLDAALPAAISRLHTLLASGTGVQPAWHRVLSDLPPGSPLHAEWSFVLDHLGASQGGGRLATMAEVVATLALQTPSGQHRALLEHLGLALRQPHDSQVRRLAAAAEALLAAERRRSAAVTALAQMRYSGLVVGGSGLCLSAYLALVQRERLVLAYGGAVGGLVAVVVLAALLAPVIGGLLLAQVPDEDY